MPPQIPQKCDRGTLSCQLLELQGLPSTLRVIASSTKSIVAYAFFFDLGRLTKRTPNSACAPRLPASNLSWNARRIPVRDLRTARRDTLPSLNTSEASMSSRGIAACCARILGALGIVRLGRDLLCRMDLSKPLYHRRRFPAEIISHCVWLYFRFCLSYRDVEEMMAERGVVVTYETIRDWSHQFGGTYAKRLRSRTPRPGDRWHLDEVYLSINGKLQD